MGARDEDLDGEAVLVPRPCPPLGVAGPDGAQQFVLPMAPSQRHRGAAREPKVRA
jgi:hypothetical protein